MTTTGYDWPYRLTRADILAENRSLLGLRSIHIFEPLHKDGLLIRLNRPRVACLLQVFPAAELGTWNCDMWRAETDEKETAELALQVARVSAPPHAQFTMNERIEWGRAHPGTTPNIGPTRHGLAMCMKYSFINEMSIVLDQGQSQ
jgi:hypothetical protein